METKDNPIHQCKLKFDSDSKGNFEGYASVFNSNDAVDDTILPGAFKDSVGSRVKMFVNHDHRQVPIGTWREMKEDSYGLFAVGSINLDHKDGPSVYSAMKRGDMDGLSIGFTLKQGDYEKKDTGGKLIKSLSLKETSVVTFPCEPKAMITGVKFEEAETIRDLERLIRDEFGCSKSVACDFLSHAKRILGGDLPRYEKRISELEKLLNQNQIERLIHVLNR